MEGSAPAQDDVEASATAVAGMGPPHRRNAPGMAGMGQPVVDRRPDPPALERRIALPFMAGDQQQYPLTPADRAFERLVDGQPCLIKAHAVEVENPLGIDPPGAQPPVPPPVQRR